MFVGYKDGLHEDIKDGEVIFNIEDFIQLHPTDYKPFYKDFFQHNVNQLEHFGFMEFLNIKYADAHDFEQAQKKEVFDSLAEQLMSDRKAFKDDE